MAASVSGTRESGLRPTSLQERRRADTETEERGGFPSRPSLMLLSRDRSIPIPSNS